MRFKGCLLDNTKGKKKTLLCCSKQSKPGKAKTNKKKANLSQTKMIFSDLSDMFFFNFYTRVKQADKAGNSLLLWGGMYSLGFGASDCMWSVYM